MTDEQIDRVLEQIEKLDVRLRDMDTKVTKLEVVVVELDKRLDRQYTLMVAIKADLGVLTNIQYRLEQEEKRGNVLEATANTRSALIADLDSRLKSIDAHVSELLTWKMTFWHRVFAVALSVSATIVAGWNWFLRH